ncbi:sushi, von Willebrand factor type A, EGF and pentraxin domain-containing protein 1-like [Ruditapes philippinarum]|uniref:sushi, von Willebrand factor type A, EGF and pentraxin domain-containing protein 1-like n=1 Tax=Ruditapes philippinarum TaxID=129788 RepID=UPI00295A57E2|nr:sushi, von Willebrand factor type A, EGF and pentraxin domain-containing protein 1-like [Ruditapes philippinarum]
MKQERDTTRLGYVGNIHHRGNTDDDEEFKRTYASELTLSEKYGKTIQQTSTTEKTVKVTASKVQEGEKTYSFTTSLWVIGFVATLAVFTGSKIGRENIKRVITDCREPGSIPYGSIVVNEEEGTKYGAKATVVCSHGYSSSNPEAVCQANGKWSSVYCHVTDCGNTLPQIENGQSTMNSEQDSTFGATATVTCAPGYQRNKPKISCQADGMWEQATCQPVDCGNTLPLIEKGQSTMNSEQDSTFGATATVTCAPGYQRNKPKISCQANGMWEQATCQPVDCGNTLPPIEKGQSTMNSEQDSTFGATATVTCAPGYQRNKPKISCQANGMWEQATCQPVDCSNPKIEHGHLEWDSTLFLSQATVKCDTGYAPSQPHVTCTASGTWQNVVCYNIDDCSNNPCKNGGQCEDKVADYVCKCQRGYSGKNCELDTRCANHQCKNGGKCEPNPNGYTCKCPPHIDGNFCESPHQG